MRLAGLIRAAARRGAPPMRLRLWCSYLLPAFLGLLQGLDRCLGPQKMATALSSRLGFRPALPGRSSGFTGALLAAMAAWLPACGCLLAARNRAVVLSHARAPHTLCLLRSARTPAQVRPAPPGRRRARGAAAADAAAAQPAGQPAA